MLNFLKDAVVTRVSNAAVAGATSINCTHVDMQGFDGVCFVAFLGALTATQVTKLKAQSGALSDNSDMADITGTETAAMADGDGNKMLLVDVLRPQARYVRAVLERGTANAVVDAVLAIQYRSSKKPVTQPASVSQSTLTVF